MADDLRTHDAAETTLSIGGILIDSGYADGEYLSVEPQAEDFTDKVGTDGSVVRSRTHDQRATIKLKLLATSKGNAVLTQLRALALNTTNGADVGAFVLRDRLTGVMLARSAQVWVQKPPTLSRGREVAEYEWTLRAAKMVFDFTGAV